MPNNRKLHNEGSFAIEESNIFQYENGIEVFSCLDTLKPNLIFSDWNMPLMNELDLIKKIRLTDGVSKNVPVVMNKIKIMGVDVSLELHFYILEGTPL